MLRMPLLYAAKFSLTVEIQLRPETAICYDTVRRSSKELVDTRESHIGLSPSLSPEHMDVIASDSLSLVSFCSRVSLCPSAADSFLTWYSTVSLIFVLIVILHVVPSKHNLLFQGRTYIRRSFRSTSWSVDPNSIFGVTFHHGPEHKSPPFWRPVGRHHSCPAATYFCEGQPAYRIII